MMRSPETVCRCGHTFGEHLRTRLDKVDCNQSGCNCEDFAATWIDWTKGVSANE